MKIFNNVGAFLASQTPMWLFFPLVPKNFHALLSKLMQKDSTENV